MAARTCALGIALSSAQHSATLTFAHATALSSFVRKTARSLTLLSAHVGCARMEARTYALGMALSSAQHSATALSSFARKAARSLTLLSAHVGCARMAAHSMTPICSPHLSNSAGQRSVQCDAHFECSVSVPAQWRSGASRATLRKWHFTPWRRRAQGG